MSITNGRFVHMSVVVDDQRTGILLEELLAIKDQAPMAALIIENVLRVDFNRQIDFEFDTAEGRDS